MDGKEQMETKKISVIVPVYNSINCLERCVRSLCAQTYEIGRASCRERVSKSV